MSVLVLGGTGFVGKSVCECLSQHQVKYHIASLSSGVDLRNFSDTVRLMQRCQPEIIINCAAHVGSLNYVTQQAARIVVDNSKMILGMYEAVAQVCPSATIINPIANCAYPATANSFVEEEWLNGQLHRSVLSYGATRRFLWSVSECFFMQFGLRSISLMTPNMYGPHDSTDPNKAHALNALIAKFVKAEQLEQPVLEIWGTGIAIREWLYAKDFARIILWILNNPKMLGLAEPINIAQNFGLSVRELVGIIQEQFDFQGKIVFDETKPDGAPRKVMDNRRFNRTFPGFEFTSLPAGIAETIKYYRSLWPY